MAPSGAGKTTLLRILLGLETPDSGTIRGLGDARVSAVFQEDRLLEHLTGPENLRFVLGSAYEASASTALLERLGLEGLNAKPVREYSGGMIARSEETAKRQGSLSAGEKYECRSCGRCKRHSPASR